MSGKRAIHRTIRQLLDAEQRAWVESIRPAPYEYRGRIVQKPRAHITVRKAQAPGELHPFIETIILEWVRGQSERWIGRRHGLDRETVHRWVVKHPHEVQRALDEAGSYGGLTEYWLRRRAATMRAIGVVVGNR